MESSDGQPIKSGVSTDVNENVKFSREDRLKNLKEKQNEERVRKLEELKQHALQAAKLREEQDIRRKKHFEEFGKKEEERRRQAEERRRVLEEERKSSVVSKWESKKVNSSRGVLVGSKPLFAFGSCTPRLVDNHVDGCLWKSQYNLNSTRDAPHKSTSAHDLFSQMNMSTSMYEWNQQRTTFNAPQPPPRFRRCRNAELDPDRVFCGRRKTDLTPTLPIRRDESYSRSGSRGVSGRVYSSMTRLPPYNPSHLIGNYLTTSPSPPNNDNKMRVGRSKSTNTLSTSSPIPAKLNRTQLLRQNLTTSVKERGRSGNTTPSSRPPSALSSLMTSSTHSTLSMRPRTLAPRKSRPVSVHITGVSSELTTHLTEGTPTPPPRAHLSKSPRSLSAHPPLKNTKLSEKIKSSEKLNERKSSERSSEKLNDKRISEKKANEKLNEKKVSEKSSNSAPNEKKVSEKSSNSAPNEKKMSEKSSNSAPNERKMSSDKKGSEKLIEKIKAKKEAESRKSEAKIDSSTIRRGKSKKEESPSPGLATLKIEPNNVKIEESGGGSGNVSAGTEVQKSFEFLESEKMSGGEEAIFEPIGDNPFTVSANESFEFTKSNEQSSFEFKNEGLISLEQAQTERSFDSDFVSIVNVGQLNSKVTENNIKIEKDEAIPSNGNPFLLDFGDNNDMNHQIQADLFSSTTFNDTNKIGFGDEVVNFVSNVQNEPPPPYFTQDNKDNVVSKTEEIKDEKPNLTLFEEILKTSLNEPDTSVEAQEDAKIVVAKENHVESVITISDAKETNGVKNSEEVDESPLANGGGGEPISSTIEESNGSVKDESSSGGGLVDGGEVKLRLRTEEDAKAALAEKRRLAREAQEREIARLEEEERREEERQRVEAEEAERLATKAREMEEERLRVAIEEQRQRELLNQKRREEEETLKQEREKEEREAAREAERIRLEMEERLKREEEERQERKKRVEAIMSRTRKSGQDSAKATTPVPDEIPEVKFSNGVQNTIEVSTTLTPTPTLNSLNNYNNNNDFSSTLIDFGEMSGSNGVTQSNNTSNLITSSNALQDLLS